MKKILFIILILSNVILTAGDTEKKTEGFKALELKQYDKAYKLIKPLADNGDGESLLVISAMYFQGLGVQKDVNKAITYAEKASNLGKQEAPVVLASIYFTLNRVSEGRTILENAADKGNLKAIGKLSSIYYDMGDFKNAFMYAKKAADMGDKIFQARTAVFYEFGQGIDKNIKLAISYYEKSFNNGYIQAGLELAKIYHIGVKVTKDLDKAINIYKKLADAGIVFPQVMLGRIYQIDKKDMETAKTWYKKALNSKANEIDTAFAQSSYADFLALNREYKEAFSFMSLAAQSGYLEAQYRLASYYENKTGTSQNFDKALYWYKMAAERGHEKASEILKNSEKHFTFTKKLFSDKLHQDVITSYILDYEKDAKSIQITSKQVDKKYNETVVYFTYNKNQKRMYGKIFLGKSDLDSWIANGFKASSNKDDIL